MAPSTRNFLIGSAFVVVAGFCTGLVAYWGGALPGRDAARAEFTYIPSDVSAVAYADVRDIMDSEFHAKLRQVMKPGDEKDELFDRTGIDLERDIDSVLAGFTGPAAGSGKGGGIVVFRGRFDRARIEGLATEHGAQLEQYGGKVLLVGLNDGNDSPMRDQSSPGSPDHVPALAFLDDNLLALGDVESLRRAIDSAANNQDVTTNTNLMRFISGVQGSGNAWLVGRADQITSHENVPSQVRSQVEGLEWLAISADIDKDVRGLVRAEARDDATGQQMRSILAGALAAARMFGEQDPRVAMALNSIQTTGAGRNIELSFQVPATLLDLMSSMQDHAAPPAPPEAPVPPAPPVPAR
jgi:hypothetical protein